MKYLIDKYKEPILNIGMGYFDLSGEQNNDRIILNLYTSPFKSGLTSSIVLDLRSDTISSFGKGGFNSNIKYIENNKLYLCDGSYYEFNEINEIIELGIKKEVYNDGFKLLKENSLYEEYYYPIDETRYALTFITNKNTNKDILTNQYSNDTLTHTWVQKEMINDNVETDVSETISYWYNQNNLIREVRIEKGLTRLKRFTLTYTLNNKLHSIKGYEKQGNVEKLFLDYTFSLNEVMDGFMPFNESYTFTDNITGLTKTISYNFDNTLSIIEEYG